jgi:hypothetical protein
MKPNSDKSTASEAKLLSKPASARPPDIVSVSDLIVESALPVINAVLSFMSWPVAKSTLEIKINAECRRGVRLGWGE